MQSRALVTGASGFIGSTLIEQLNEKGFEVHALLRRSSSLANLKEASFKRVEGDLSDLDSLKKAVREVDYVFHLAGATAAPDRAAYFRHNAEGTGLLARAVAEERPGLTRFVYVSSLAAAGPAAGLSPREESEAERPVSSYGESKLQGEKEVLRYRDAYPISIVRPPIVYGPRDKGVFVIIQTVARRVMPILLGSGPDGKKHYSVVHSSDLCRGIVAAGLASRERVASGEVFYICSDEIHSYGEFLGTMATALGRLPFLKIPVPKPVVSFAGYGAHFAGKLTGRSYPLNLDKLNEILPDYWICTNRKAKEKLGFTPEFDLAKGMAHAVEWYRKNGWL
ncbi:MAG: NAD-dependent epimerase/dehydratase family protein [Oligoflexia bacterium]|nr:NAD-dependent epimerase/dehydratase family protein [Oligoflexia bacterium]